MGRPDDPDVVTAARGRLFGVEALLVIHASLIPRVPSANTHLAVIALAERLSAAFQEDHGLQRRSSADLPTPDAT